MGLWMFPTRSHLPNLTDSGCRIPARSLLVDFRPSCYTQGVYFWQQLVKGSWGFSAWSAVSLDTPVIMVQSGTAGHRRFTDKNLTYVSVSHLLWDPHFLSHSVFHRFRQAKVCGVYKKGYIGYQWNPPNSRSNLNVVAWKCCSYLQNQVTSYRKESTTLKGVPVIPACAPSTGWLLYNGSNWSHTTMNLLWTLGRQTIITHTHKKSFIPQL